jgi:hypothetical protein
MGEAETIAVLLRLLRLLLRSLANYLRDARPWYLAEHQGAWDAVPRLAADQQRYARRVAQALLALGTRPEPGPFPLRFTAVHDLSLAYLLEALVAEQRQAVAEIAQCVAALAAILPLRELAEEILGNAQGHLEILEAALHEVKNPAGGDVANPG